MTFDVFFGRKTKKYFGLITGRRVSVVVVVATSYDAAPYGETGNSHRMSSFLAK